MNNPTRNEHHSLPRHALLTVGLAAALAACGGGSSNDESATISSANTEPATSAPSPAGHSTASASSAAVPSQVSSMPNLAVLPSFHMAAVALEEPSDIDVGGTNLSARQAPLSVQVSAELASIDTTRLTPQSLSRKLSQMRMASVASVAASGTKVTPQSLPIVAKFYTPAQMRAAYGLPALPPVGTTLTAQAAAQYGAGQSIYIVDANHNANAFSDLNLFSSKFGLPTCTNVAITAAGPLPAQGAGCEFSVVYSSTTGGVTTTAPPVDATWSLEIALDVQWAHAIAPLARIVLVEAKQAQTTDLMNAVTLANTFGPGIVSMSFGGAEGSWVTGADSYFGATGMTYLAATGDAGAGVEWPAVSPKVLAVGGTSMNYSGGSPRYEAAWAGAGGGVSSYAPLPAYQNGVSLAGGKLAMRAVSDVSFNADPNTGQYVALTAPGAAITMWNPVGGTSIATPQWAGLLAIANAVRVANNDGMLADIHPLLYGTIAAVPANYASAFSDIVDGGDGSCATCKSGAGFDQATGWGTPNFSGLMSLLTNSTLPPLPGSVMTSGVGGTAYRATWPATDAAGHALTYALTNAPSGLTVSAAGAVAWAAPVEGSYSFTVAVTAASGSTASGSETLVISKAPPPPPAAPVVSGGAYVTKTGVAFSQSLGINAPSGATLTYSISGAPTGLTVKAGTLAWAVPVAGQYSFSVTAISSAGPSGSGTYTLAVIPYTKPVIAAAAALTAKVGTAFSASVSATNPNKGTLSYSLSGAPDGLSISSVGLMTWSTPTAGTFSITVTAADNYGLSVSKTFTLTSIALNHAPFVDGKSFTALTTSPFSAQATGSDPDGDKLTYILTAAPVGLTMTPAGVLNWAKPVKGAYSVKVTAKDPHGLTGTGTYTLTFTTPNMAPKVAAGSVAGKVGTALTFATVASDGNGDKLTYSLFGAPDGLTVSAAGVLNWAKPVAGAYAVTVQASDPWGLSGSNVVSIAVSQPNRAPVVIAGQVFKAQPGNGFSGQVIATDADGDAISFSMTGAPVGLKLSADGTLNWDAPVKGTFSPTISAKDPKGAVGTHTITLIITA